MVTETHWSNAVTHQGIAGTDATRTHSKKGMRQLHLWGLRWNRNPSWLSFLPFGPQNWERKICIFKTPCFVAVACYDSPRNNRIMAWAEPSQEAAWRTQRNWAFGAPSPWPSYPDGKISVFQCSSQSSIIFKSQNSLDFFLLAAISLTLTCMCTCLCICIEKSGY